MMLRTLFFIVNSARFMCQIRPVSGQGCNRDIAFFKSAAIAQGCNIVREELGVEMREIPAANPELQTDIVPETPDHCGRLPCRHDGPRFRSIRAPRQRSDAS